MNPEEKTVNDTAIQAAVDQALGAAPEAHPAPPRLPMPVAARVSQLQAPDGKIMIRFDMATPAGENTYYFDGETARNFARQIIKLSRAAEAGLIIPG